MWLTTPETIEHVLVERPLEPVSDDALNQFARDWQSRGTKSAPREGLRNVPVVSIGPAETWTLQDFYSPSKLPLPIEQSSVRLTFTWSAFPVRSALFTKRAASSGLAFAPFSPHSSTGAQPIAFDLFPLQVLQEVKHKIKVTLSPSLKFKELEASLGGAEFGNEYTELIPLVSAAIGAGFDPSWDYRAGSGQELQGTKWMHLLVKAPKGMTSGRALLELEADVQGGRCSPACDHLAQAGQEPEQLTVTLWG